MQSLKSTAVAVVLLAISFGLYNFSGTSAPPEDKDNLLEQLGIGDGSSGVLENGQTAINNGLNSIQNGVNEFSQKADGLVQKVDEFSQKASEFTQGMPDLPNLSQQGFADMKNGLQNKVDAARDQFNQASTQFANAANNTVRSFNDLEAPSLGQPSVASTPAPGFTNRQVVDESRDDGLIDALAGNNGPGQTAEPSFNAPTNRDFSSTTTDFVSTQPAQPIANSDSSMNTLAAGTSPERSGGFDSAVRSADMEAAYNGGPLSVNDFNSAWGQVDRMVQENNFRGALGLLSRFYGNENLNGPQKQRLQGWLDALAGKVIYSAEHNFFPKPYIVKAGDTVDLLAQRWQVPPQLIYNINRDRFAAGSMLMPGTELKMVSGPFNAQIDLSENMMVLEVKNLYAGRFPVQVGLSGNAAPGSYQVVAKSPEGFTWRDANGIDYPPGSPQNGYGPHWIGLTGSLCIHALGQGAASSSLGHRGCVGLSTADAKDVFGILDKSSTVSITR